MSSQTPCDIKQEDTWENLGEGIKRAVIALRDFAQKNEKDFQYVLSLNPADLAEFLKEFYLALRDTNDDDSSIGSHLTRVRSDLQEYFLKVSSIDIINGPEFTDSSTVAEEVKADPSTKQPVIKKHTRQRTFTFETSELRQIYMSDAMNLDQPETLQNKVFFDVCMYICNRGKDFLRLMTKNDFEVSTDQSGRRYVWLKYDTKFSFQEVAGGMTCEGAVGTQIGERMYERPGDPKCPVLSYTQYMIHLHPMSDAFWQRPKRSILPTDFVWYDNICIGNSTLNKLMNRITQSADAKHSNRPTDFVWYDHIGIDDSNLNKLLNIHAIEHGAFCTVQWNRLQDSYAINAIKSSYIPIVESICRSALFGSQQFRRILQMKQANHEIHHVRKRHSEGSLSIASVLRESPLFRPRHSEPQLQVYRLQNSETEMMRSNSASPVLRAGSWEPGSQHMILQKTPERIDAPETGYQLYRNSEKEGLGPGFQPNYSHDGSQQEMPQDMSMSDHSQGTSARNSQMYGGEEEEKTQLKIGGLLQAKQKCLDIVHSLEVRDLKSFINWMKTFEVKHGPAGLMVTCQPVTSGEMETQGMQRPVEQNGTSGNVPLKRETMNYSNTGRQSGSSRLPDTHELDMKNPEFNCIGDTYCSSAELSPLKITIPTQDTVLLTGMKSSSQILVHSKFEDGNQVQDQKYSPLHSRIFTSSERYSLDQIDCVTLKHQNNCSNDFKGENHHPVDSTRTNSFKEEKSMPMKKRYVMDQSEKPHHSSPSEMSPPLPFPQSRSPPNYAMRHSSALGYMTQTGYPGSPVSQPSVPKYRERFPDGWGYIPRQKRQKFGVPLNKDEAPLDLIKQS